MTIYRKIYEEHYGPIPIDEEGRTYDIHHIDGNHNNNDPKNLVAISIKDHYNIHYEQKDWNACYIMAQRMKLDPKLISELAHKTQQKRLKDGTHNFLGDKNPMKKRLDDGTHHFYGGKIQGETSRKRVKNKTHNWLNQPKIDCPYCDKKMTPGPLIMHINFKHKDIKNDTR
jgi:hypothetical protein